MNGVAETTVSLPEDVLNAARNFASARHRSLDQLTEAALRSFIGLHEGSDPALETNRQEACALGLTPDEYAVYVVKQLRSERRVEQEQASAA